MENDQKLAHIRQLIQSAESSLESAKHLLNQLTGEETAPTSTGESLADVAREMGSVHEDGNNRIINGIFDGQHMIGPDGKQYSVPANYASKSKLVEGDMLKLTIMHDGSFVYKQVGPIDRSRVIGVLSYEDANEQWLVALNDKIYKVLLASVTYFKGDIGDEVVLLIPKGKNAVWGAIENIIKKGQARPEGLVEGDVPAELPESDVAETSEEEIEEASDETTEDTEAMEEETSDALDEL